mgnify:CR=1 FL=1
MKVLAVIGLFVLALSFLLAPWRFAFTRGWGVVRGIGFSGRHLRSALGHLALTLLCISRRAADSKSVGEKTVLALLDKDVLTLSEAFWVSCSLPSLPSP